MVNDLTPLSFNKEIIIVSENILTPITLSTDKMSIILDEEQCAYFTMMLLGAKSAGWSGGHDLVEVRMGENNRPLVFNLKIDTYAHIDSNEALELAEILTRMERGDDGVLDVGDFPNRIIALLESGDVDVEIG